MKILPTPDITIGKDSTEEVANILNKLKARYVLVVTDKGIINAGIYNKLQSVLQNAGKEIVLFDRVEPDPSINLVNEVVHLIREHDVDAVIGIGGGSSIDTAKVAAALSTNTKSIDNYIGIDLLDKEALPIIAIPTTAGTGSEVTPIAILSDEEEQLKKGIVSNKIIPKYAVLDPALTTGLPPHVTAATGMDALTHAVESYTSNKAFVYSDVIALKAIDLIRDNIVEAYNDGSNITARENMLWGSLLGGIAFSNAGVAAVHAFAYPLGGMFHVAHGLANSVMLSTIMAYNTVGNEERYSDIAKALTGDKHATYYDGVRKVDELCVKLNIPANLEALKIPYDAIQDLAEGAMKVTRLLVNNPREIQLNDAVELYTAAYTRNTALTTMN